MAWKRLTFILIPHSQSTIKQVSLPRPVIYTVLAFLGLSVCLMIFYILGFRGKAFYAERAREMTAENAVLEHQLAVFDTSISVMQARVTVLDSLNQTIIRESKISDDDLPSGNGSEGDAVRHYRLSTERMLDMLGDMDKRSRRLEDEFNSLYDIAMKNSALLRGIPSIRPAEGPVLKEFGPVVDEATGREKMNEGVNINNVEGTPVVATADGVVSAVQLNATDENGIYVVISHGNGYETVYTHLRPDVLVRSGERVSRGRRIGSIGRTGIMLVQVAPHILYKVRRNGVYLDPANFFFAPLFAAETDTNTGS